MIFLSALTTKQKVFKGRQKHTFRDGCGTRPQFSQLKIPFLGSDNALAPKYHFQGWIMARPAPRNRYLGAGYTMTHPYKSICSKYKNKKKQQNKKEKIFQPTSHHHQQQTPAESYHSALTSGSRSQWTCQHQLNNIIQVCSLVIRLCLVLLFPDADRPRKMYIS